MGQEDDRPPTDVLDWSRVKWRSPRMNRPHTCCYCKQSMTPGTKSLIVVDDAGSSAEFCLQCMKRFGPQMIPPDHKRF